MEMEVKGMKSQRKELEKEVQEKVGKKPFEEPELIFIEPKLTKHGDATKITANDNAFFGSFDPGDAGLE